MSDTLLGPEASPIASLAEATILMLDDDPTMRAAVRLTLRAAGCMNFLQTGNGHEALRLLVGNKVDLVLCDCQMPAMEGMDFLRRLRESQAGASVPVIMLTVNQNARDAWEAHKLNVAGWLVKPLTPQNVAAQVAATLGRLPPRVPENLLAELVQSYEAELPHVVSRLHTQANDWLPPAADFTVRLDQLHRRLHQVKGQAGTMGYQLLGDLAGLLHDTMRLAVEDAGAVEPHREELVRLARVGTAGMKLVAERRLRGDGGAAGARMKQQIGDFAAALAGKLGSAAARRGPTRRHG